MAEYRDFQLTGKHTRGALAFARKSLPRLANAASAAVAGRRNSAAPKPPADHDALTIPAPWAAPLLTAVAFAESRKARIVGVTGIRSGVGTERIAAALAAACSQHGKRVLFAAAEAPKLDATDGEASGEPAGFAAAAVRVNAGLSRLDLTTEDRVYPASTDYFRAAFENALTGFDAVVVGLPDAGADTGLPPPAFRILSRACDFVFLVCATGRTTQEEIRQCLASCRINGTDLHGVLLNDGRLPMSRLLTGV